MKWVIDLEQTIVVTKEMVVDAPAFNDALDQVHDRLRLMAVDAVVDIEDWDTVDTGEVRIETPVRLLDRRAQQRRDPAFTLAQDQCDVCNSAGLHTNDYAGARVCDTCLLGLPPLTG